MKFKSFIFVSSLYAASITHADNFYVLGAAGQSHFENSKNAADDAVSANDSGGVPYDFKNNNLGYKLQLGYQVNPNFAVEGGYVDLGQQNYHVAYDTGDAKAKVRSRGLNVDTLGILPVNSEFSVFGKLGVIDAKTRYHIDGSDDDGEFADSREKYRWSPNFGVGANYAVNDETSLRLELERFEDIGSKSTTGEQNVDLVSLGVSYRFN